MFHFNKSEFIKKMSYKVIQNRNIVWIRFVYETYMKHRVEVTKYAKFHKSTLKYTKFHQDD